jgi:hypothetical protein
VGVRRGGFAGFDDDLIDSKLYDAERLRPLPDRRPAGVERPRRDRIWADDAAAADSVT